MKAISATALIVTGFASLLIAACSGLPDRSHDRATISIGHPRVVSRERFIADRNADQEWLREQLGKDEYYQRSTQGSVLSRVLDSTDVSADVKVDLVKALAEMASVAANGDGGDGGDGNDDGDGDEDGGDGRQQSGAGLGNELIKQGLSASLADPDQGPVDFLKDRLAFRDEVRSQIRLRSLDDTHDHYGNTLHELTFDLSLFPGQDTGDPYVVLMAIDNASCKASEDAAKGVVESLRAYALQIAQDRTRRMADGLTTSGDLEWLADVESWAIVDAKAASTQRAYLRMRVLHEAVSPICSMLTYTGSGTPNPDTFAKWAFAALDSDEDAKKVLAKTGLSDTRVLKSTLRELAESSVCGLLHTPTSTLGYTRKSLGSAFVDPGSSVPPPSFAPIESERAALRARINEFDGDYEKLVVAVLLAKYADIDVSGTSYKILSSEVAKQLELFSDEARTEAFVASEIVRLAPAAGVQVERPDHSLVPIYQIVGDRQAWENFKSEVLAQIGIQPPQEDLLRARAYFAALHAGLLVERESADSLALVSPYVEPVVLADAEDERASVEAFVPKLEAKPDRGPLKTKLRTIDDSRRTRAIAVFPTEQAENFNVNLGSLVSRSLDVAVSGRFGTQVQGGGALNRLRQELLRVTQLERRPLVVGFVGANTKMARGPGDSSSGASGDRVDERSTFGWLISPRLEARQGPFGGVQEYERQIAIHKPVTVTIVAPAQLDELKLKVYAYRICESGAWIPANEVLMPPDTTQGSLAHYSCKVGRGRGLEHQITVPLPIDGDAYARGLIHGNNRAAAQPMVSSANPKTFTSGAAGSLLVLGSNLWRSPEVYIGGQKASPVSVTSDLNGLSATFAPVALPAGTYDLTVVTSAGHALLKDEITVRPGFSTASLDTKGPLGVDSKNNVTMKFTLTPALTGWDKFMMRIRDGDTEYLPLSEVTVLGVTDGGRALEVRAAISKKVEELAKAVEVQLYVVPDPKAAPKRVSSDAKVTLVSHAWLTRKVTGTLASGEIGEEELEPPAGGAKQKLGVFKKDAVVEFKLGGVSWDDIRAATGIKEPIEKAAKGAIEKVKNDYGVSEVKFSASGNALIEFKLAEPAGKSYLRPDEPITFKLADGVELTLQTPKK